MRRSPLGPGKRSVQRGSTFASRGQGLGRARRARRDPVTVLAASSWKAGVATAACVMCAARPVHGHHIVTQQEIRKAAARTGGDVDELLWDQRNRLALCADCHASHHARSHPIPFNVLLTHAPASLEFASELGLDWWIERTYPDV